MASTSHLTHTPSTSYLVVILSGPGEELFPLVSTPDVSSDHRPLHPHLAKPCLPILNRPMIEFGLDWVEESGLSEVLILASETQRSSLNTLIKSRKGSAHSVLQIRLECIPDRQLKREGTTGTLRWAVQEGMIRTAFVLLPCDLYFRSCPQPTRNPAQAPVTSSRSLLDLVERHRAAQNLLTAVFYHRFPDSKDAAPLTLTTLDPRTGTLLDTHELGPDLSLRPGLLNRFPTPVLTTSLLPTHIYLCSALVPALLNSAAEGRMRSFKHDLVPWLAKAQWQPGLIEKRLIPGKSVGDPSDSQSRAYRRTTTHPSPLPASCPSPSSLTRTPLTLPSTPSMAVRNHSMVSMEAVVASLGAERGENGRQGWRCEVVVWAAEDGFVGRANTVGGYTESNRVALKAYEEEMRRAGKRAEAGTGYALDSCVGTGVVMGEKCSVKKSVVGKCCRIGKGARVSNSVLMERVMIGENAKLENCVLADGVRIGDRAQLKECEVGPGSVVADDMIYKGERITDSDI
ncbi:hypothetical protein CROQUDRAFT_664680 [Cronartium quercuum f. sp. fusiforme G11]|uniref:Translation initiation factor eIF2B subunit gamma n=1 Tax=Cronartium quercuum f. sp. fusiforme G11 TaxID=708437 RepID=A0A9P6N7M7_9BASI|nr:hypothetical protein CROQUDRAFT_664680 [Cronartium quercuum f. sp. fusiforme G11]